MANQLIKYKGQIYKLAVADMSLQVMLLRPGKQFDESKFYVKPGAIEGTTGYLGSNKPYSRTGNLCWTSSLVGQQTDWLTWCATDSPHWIGEQAVIFKVNQQAKIAHIGSEQQYNSLVNHYPAQEHSKGRCIDFAKLAQDYDAVHVFSEGLYVNDLYGWDVESTAWFDPNLLEFARIVDVKHECSIPAEQEAEDWERNRATSYKIDASAKPKFIDILGHRYSVVSH